MTPKNLMCKPRMVVSLLPASCSAFDLRMVSQSVMSIICRSYYHFVNKSEMKQTESYS